MLFNSASFLFGFLPIVLAGTAATARFGHRAAMLWLIVASLVFYGWFSPAAVPLLAVSIAANHALVRLLSRTASRPALQGWILRAGIVGNLAALGYCKYLGWVTELANNTGLFNFPEPSVVLPLGISFFTFTQIGYLLDVRDEASGRHNLLSYALFVTFFPHLIAGPILQSREIMPQLQDPARWRCSAANISVGLAIFIVGLAKKTLLADPASAGVAEAFADPGALSLFNAWHAALSYSLQLYFDFSGYSDMAIGLARMFNLRFPLNFDSPYKARSVIDYWQSWHMTLTRYLTRYIYSPLSLALLRRRIARKLPVNQAAQRTPSGFLTMIALPAFVTIGLAGLWHGSGAQFVVFGLLHASFLTVNRAWRLWRGPARPVRGVGTVWRVLLTYGCVLIGSVFFRAGSVPDALSMLAGMAGLHGVGPGVPLPGWAAAGILSTAEDSAWGDATGWHETIHAARAIGWLIALYAVVWGLPNTQQIFARAEPALEAIALPAPTWLRWRPTLPWAVGLGGLGMLALLALGGTGEFLYFQF